MSALIEKEKEVEKQRRKKLCGGIELSWQEVEEIIGDYAKQIRIPDFEKFAELVQKTIEDELSSKV